jgi:hypothetical protein
MCLCVTTNNLKMNSQKTRRVEGVNQYKERGLSCKTRYINVGLLNRVTLEVEWSFTQDETGEATSTGAEMDAAGTDKQRQTQRHMEKNIGDRAEISK